MTVSARLRVLRLVGFKSFAEKTVLEFGPGISAVIGPNGSGKSNLADALRWALGEQGRALRARRAEDVIFAGSARRHATGMADVSLVMDNEDGLLPIDFGTLEFGRRLYRSGENEYLLNRQRVRLRDLSDLLDGANLADNAFLFIGQGMVDQALSLRPEERRPLFEEVAGVRRHERRRRQAEVQLVEAEQNLTRLRDILGELRPQARRLATQAEQAEAREAAGQTLAAEVVRSARARGPAAARRALQTQAEHEAARAAADEALAELHAAERSAEALAEALEAGAATVQARRHERDAAQARLAETRLADQRLALELGIVSRDRERLGEERLAVVGRIATGRRAAAQAIPAADPGLELALDALDRALAEASVEAERARTAHRLEGEREASLRRVRAVQAAELEQAERRLAALAARTDAAALARDEATAAAAAAASQAQVAGRLASAGRQAETQAEAD
ncbi:MAG: AAA family ATPase, partial [Candidatus Limnocylindrales bacterium]